MAELSYIFARMLKSFLLATISGLFLAASWPTYGFPALLFIAFIPLLIIEKQFTDAPFQKKSLRIFLLSWWAFLLWNALSYNWLSQARPQMDATSMEIQQAWIAYLFPVILNSLFMAIVFITYHFIRKKHGEFYGFIFLPAFWMSFEKLHLNWDFTWPWLNLGNGFASYYKWVQWYDLTGSFGGTLWVWVANLLLFKAILIYLEHGNRRQLKKYFAGFVGIVVIPIIISLLQYNFYEEKGEEIEIALIQPELDPYREKYTKSGEDIVEELIELSESVLTPQTNFVITPETSFPGRGEVILNEIQNDSYILKLQSWLQQYPDAVMIAGAELAKISQATQPPNPTSIHYQDNIYVNRYNSAIQLENGRNDIPIYHKSKLVVGVEYFPYPHIFKPIFGNLMLDFGGSTNSLTKTKDRIVFENSKNNARVAPLICYESVFGEFTTEFMKNGANVISVSTNDSWWGNTEGHRQFLDYARLRAIENRRDVVRAANSGISAFINQRGDVVQQLGYGKRGSIVGKAHLNNLLTNYSKSGDLIARIALLLSGVLLAYHFVEKFMNKTNKL
ncbi:MAG: apolipoprotein N-acyltransferase [Flavobacteriaceae bacterium]|nr:apolipoprotein N-acyltransferase [Flavobacteriaceae bacterium]